MKRLVTGLAAILVLAGCGTSAHVESDSSASEPSDTAPSVNWEKVQARKAEQLCRRQVSPLLKELKAVDSRLDVGMTQPDYNTALGDVSIAYDDLPTGKIEFDCLSDVAVPLEIAFNHYVAANDDWSDCIQDYYCDIDTEALPGLRKKWSASARQITKAESGLDRMGRTTLRVS